jgi:hypothetical protein
VLRQRPHLLKKEMTSLKELKVRIKEATELVIPEMLLRV